MSTPPAVSVTPGTQSYPTGAPMTATVVCAPGTVDQVTAYSAAEATGPGGETGVLAVTFTTQTPDTVVLEVAGSSGTVWDLARDDGAGTTEWQAISPATAGPLTVTATATGQGSGLATTTTATVTIMAPPAVGTNKGAWAAVSAATGPLTAYRGYVPPSAGVPSSWPGSGAGPIPPGVLPIVSLNLDVARVLSGALDAQLAAYAQAVPAGALVTLGAEDEAGRFGWTPEQIRALHARTRAIFKAGSPGCLYGQVVTTWTSHPASPHYPLATGSDPRWIAPGLGWYGLDAYAFNSSDSAAGNIGGAIAQMRLAGVDGPWVIAECNTAHGGRAAWFEAVYDYATQIRALAVCSFWGASPYQWDAADTDTIGALSRIASIGRQ